MFGQMMAGVDDDYVRYVMRAQVQVLEQIEHDEQIEQARLGSGRVRRRRPTRCRARRRSREPPGPPGSTGPPMDRPRTAPTRTGPTAPHPLPPPGTAVARTTAGHTAADARTAATTAAKTAAKTAGRDRREPRRTRLGGDRRRGATQDAGRRPRPPDRPTRSGRGRAWPDPAAVASRRPRRPAGRDAAGPAGQARRPREARPQRSVLVRERQEVQALPRPLSDARPLCHCHAPETRCGI